MKCRLELSCFLAKTLLTIFMMCTFIKSIHYYVAVKEMINQLEINNRQAAAHRAKGSSGSKAPPNSPKDIEDPKTNPTSSSPTVPVHKGTEDELSPSKMSKQEAACKEEEDLKRAIGMHFILKNYLYILVYVS